MNPHHSGCQNANRQAGNSNNNNSAVRVINPFGRGSSSTPHSSVPLLVLPPTLLKNACALGTGDSISHTISNPKVLVSHATTPCSDRTNIDHDDGRNPFFSSRHHDNSDVKSDNNTNTNSNTTTNNNNNIGVYACKDAATTMSKALDESVGGKDNEPVFVGMEVEEGEGERERERDLLDKGVEGKAMPEGGGEEEESSSRDLGGEIRSEEIEIGVKETESTRSKEQGHLEANEERKTERRGGNEKGKESEEMKAKKDEDQKTQEEQEEQDRISMTNGQAKVKTEKEEEEEEEEESDDDDKSEEGEREWEHANYPIRVLGEGSRRRRSRQGISRSRGNRSNSSGRSSSSSRGSSSDNSSSSSSKSNSSNCSSRGKRAGVDGSLRKHRSSNALGENELRRVQLSDGTSKHSSHRGVDLDSSSRLESSTAPSTPSQGGLSAKHGGGGSGGSGGSGGGGGGGNGGSFIIAPAFPTPPPTNAPLFAYPSPSVSSSPLAITPSSSFVPSSSFTPSASVKQRWTSHEIEEYNEDYEMYPKAGLYFPKQRGRGGAVGALGGESSSGGGGGGGGGSYGGLMNTRTSVSSSHTMNHHMLSASLTPSSMSPSPPP
eukprot:CAMPEP_0175077560 /NCGR_PEP_ID=MMETSP0052_2-20121109/23475_1 /TAXON_ID=51329 ORGANISM="Polytomella parva, Strain SAG 63-3" /NCGR_SAMPLE_ID=MMETSP0052_2 /ASSEMBLY_ACC=CAM_ASM_000194 /LENGTH=603 /DNA_ID=CAMNT_0016347073 /DNA_START=120 /DNA_END=1928 /DNA_ORIENTATION=-